MKQSLPIFLLVLVLSLSGGCTTERERQQMAQVIAEADSMNRNYVPMTSDSLLLEACRFYDRHGTANERMKAHYLLGCVYRDLGEAPRAIDCYQEAADCADTLAADCDYRTLGCIYSQMGDVFHQQMLLNNEINVRKHAMKYAFIARDTINGLYDYMITAGVYLIQNKKDSAEIILKTANSLYIKYGESQNALQTTVMLMHMLSSQPERSNELKALIDNYDLNCTLFDEQHELPSNRRQYYYYKGSYYNNINQLDSAEFYYRKIYYPGMGFTARDPIYRGLLSIYKKKNIADSIAKYAQLYCEVNDSSIAIKDQDLTARLAASYNYARYQKQSLDNAQKANHRLQLSIVLLIVAFIATATAALFRHRYLVSQREKREALEKLKVEFAEATDRYNKNLQTLQALEDDHRAMITQVKDELSEENGRLKAKIEELVSQSGISSSVRKMQSFMESPIARRLMELRDKPLSPMTEQDKEMLVVTTRQFYPSFLYDLQHAKNITPTGVYVGILSAMNFRSGDIANLLDLSFQQVSNIKKSISLALFNEKTARSLYMNLVKHYDFYQTSML